MSQNKTIKFFISSTFKDFEGERNILQKFIFPKLKDLCHKSGFGFQPIDLRWGVKEEAGYEQQTMNICLNEIKRSSSEPKPNLLLLVGQRYGWVPIPYDIEAGIFSKIILSDKLLEDEISLIKDWYKKDENSIPTIYYLKDKYKYKDDRNEWSKIENSVRDAFQKVVDKSFEDDIYNKFHTSATEQEMYEGLDAFDKTKNHDHTFAYFREIEKYDINDEEVEDYIDKDLSKLDNLKYRLQKNCNIPDKNKINGDDKYKVEWSQIKNAKKIKYENLTLQNAPEYLKKFHDDILEKFEISIKLEIDNFKENTKLEIELEQQKLFLDKKSEVVLGRDTEVENIKDLIANETEQYYLQYGRSGTGKTSVMAKAISDTDTDKYEIIYRFIGTTASSTYSRQLFENIYWEIESQIQKNEKLSDKDLSFEYEDDKFKKQFRAKLKEYQESRDKPLIIFLDAVDQFEDKNDLRILLDELPKNTKVVFSCLYDETKKENDDYTWYYERLKHIEDEKSKLKPLSDESRSNQEILIDILNQWLQNINRQITPDQKTHLRDNVLTKDSTPLFARLVYEIVKHWKYDEKTLYLKKDEKGLIYQFFDFIVDNYYHEKNLLEETMGLISASKDGLSEAELIDLFSRDKNFLKIFQNHRYPDLDKLPNAIWSRFYYYIQDLFTEKLIDSEMLVNSYHRIIEEAIKEKYYKKEFHSKLLKYFDDMQKNIRAFREASHALIALRANKNEIEIFLEQYNETLNHKKIFELQNIITSSIRALKLQEQDSSLVYASFNTVFIQWRLVDSFKETELTYFKQFECLANNIDYKSVFQYIEYVLKITGDINFQNSRGESFLHLVAKPETDLDRKNILINVKHLLDLNINVNLLDRYNTNALHCIAIYKCFQGHSIEKFELKELVELLNNYGINIKEKDNRELTSLAHAISCCDQELIKVLKEYYGVNYTLNESEIEFLTNVLDTEVSNNNYKNANIVFNELTKLSSKTFSQQEKYENILSLYKNNRYEEEIKFFVDEYTNNFEKYKDLGLFSLLDFIDESLIKFATFEYCKIKQKLYDDKIQVLIELEQFHYLISFIDEVLEFAKENSLDDWYSKLLEGKKYFFKQHYAFNLQFNTETDKAWFQFLSTEVDNERFHDLNDTFTLNLLFKKFTSNISSIVENEFNESLRTLLLIAKGLAIQYNNAKSIRVDELFTALHSVELSPDAKDIFTEIFGFDNMNSLRKDSDGIKLIKLAETYPKISFDKNDISLMQDLENFFGNKKILNIRKSEIDIPNRFRYEENFISKFKLLDTNAREELVFVVFLLENELEHNKCVQILLDNGFSNDTDYKTCVIKTDNELYSVRKFLNDKNIQLPSIVYYFEGEVEFARFVTI